MPPMLSKLPNGILEVQAHQLHQFVDDLTLIQLNGHIKRPIFISILQHGNETTGWEAVRVYLKQHQHKLPRTLIILFGNVQAAKHNIRQLDDGVDFNRCWPGIRPNHHPIAKKMAKITTFLKKQNPLASVDIHNNTGRNPHYAGINAIKKEHINLASLFSQTIIHITSPDGIQSGAFAEFCPAITIECGMSGTADGIEQTLTFLENLCQLTDMNHIPGVLESQQVMNIFAVVKVAKNISIALQSDTESGADFEILDDLDYHNFHQLEKGTVFGHLKTPDTAMPIQVTDQMGHDITDQYFSIESQQVVLTKSVVPAMITLSMRAIRLDCLCYLMRPLN
ncbi:MAG: peptidase M14 [Proteobacteria bacterium]|nr:MAG: peptidase M14 [Pseudomonadota bacterium]